MGGHCHADAVECTGLEIDANVTCVACLSCLYCFGTSGQVHRTLMTASNARNVKRGRSQLAFHFISMRGATWHWNWCLFKVIIWHSNKRTVSTGELSGMLITCLATQSLIACPYAWVLVIRLYMELLYIEGEKERERERDIDRYDMIFVLSLRDLSDEKY